MEKEHIECTKEQMRLAAEGHITTEALMWNQNNQRTISGMVSGYNPWIIKLYMNLPEKLKETDRALALSSL